MIRVLQVVSVMDAGGMENYIMNMYRIIDRSKVQFDFLVHHKRRGFFDDEIERLGGKIYRCTVMDDKNVLKYISDLKRIYKENNYKIVHGHLSSVAFIYLGIAKQYNVTYRISHSHNSGRLYTFKGYAKYLTSRGARLFSNIKFACSSEAGRYLFGKNNFEVIPNGICPERFLFNQGNRDKLRKEYELEDCFVIGHVGRYNLQKNHKYLLEIFKRYHDIEAKARLLLLGGGELEDAIVSQIEEMNLSEFVILAGVKKDCEKYYHTMDVFVLPSLFEGLPVTGIEAQYSGLPCVFADNISKEVKITDDVSFIGIEEKNLNEWVEKLNEINERNGRKNNRKINIKNNMYDVNISAIRMQDRYIAMGGQK